jgi:hypothetical protein
MMKHGEYSGHTIRRSYVKGFGDICRNSFSFSHFSMCRIEFEGGMAHPYSS